jgi:hypothetical protein
MAPKNNNNIITFWPITHRRSLSSTVTGGTQPNSLRAFEISTCKLPHKRCIASHRHAVQKQ